jgi:hypothetical protein
VATSLGDRIIKKLKAAVKNCLECGGRGWVGEGARHGWAGCLDPRPFDAYLCGSCNSNRELLEMPKLTDPEFLKRCEESYKYRKAMQERRP